MADVTIGSVQIRFEDFYEQQTYSPVVTGVFLQADDLTLTDGVSPVVSSVSLSINDTISLVPSPMVGSVSFNLNDTTYVPPEATMTGLFVTLESPNNSSAYHSILRGLSSKQEDVTPLQETLSLIRGASIKLPAFDGDPILAPVVRGLSAAPGEFVLMPSPDLSLVAKKRMRYFGKYTMETVADHLHSTLGSSGVSTPFSLDDSVFGEVTLSPGSFIYNGMVSEYDESQVIDISSPPAEPYYICGYIALELGSYVSRIIVTDDPTDRVIIATKDIDWSTTGSMNMAKMWNSYINHSLSDTHTNSVEKPGLTPLSNPLPPYAYLCKLTANEYDFDMAHFIFSMMASLIETTGNAPYSKCINMVSDSIFRGMKIIPTGVMGTLLEGISPRIYGPLGICADEDSRAIETQTIVKNIEVVNHIVFGVKQTASNTPANILIDIATDNETFDIEGVEPGVFIPIEDMTPLESGLFSIKAKLNLPYFNSDGAWSSQSNLPASISNHCSEFVAGKIATFGGIGALDADVPTMLINADNDTVQTTDTTISTHSTISFFDPDSDMVYVPGGLSGASTPDIFMHRISPANMSHIIDSELGNDLKSYNCYSGAIFDSAAFYGTGKSDTTLTSGWKRKVLATGVEQSVQSYFEPLYGGSSSKTYHTSNKSIHLGGWNGSEISTLPKVFNSTTLLFTPLVDVPPSFVSCGNDSDISISNRPTFVGGLSDSSGSSFVDTMFDYNSLTEVFTARPSNGFVGNSCLTLSSNGSMLRTGGAVFDGASTTPSVSKYSDQGVAMAGWGIEWQ